MVLSRKKREEKKEWYVGGKALHQGRDRKRLGGENHKCSPCLVPWSKYNDRMDFCIIALSHDHSENVPTGEIHWFCSASRVHEPTSGASRHLLPEEGGKSGFRASRPRSLPNLLTCYEVIPQSGIACTVCRLISYSLSHLRWGQRR